MVFQKYTATKQGCISGKKENPFFSSVYCLLSVFLHPHTFFVSLLHTLSLLCCLLLYLFLSYVQFLCPPLSHSLSRPCLWCQIPSGKACRSLTTGCCQDRPCGSAAGSVSSSAGASAAPASAPHMTARRCGRWR